MCGHCLQWLTTVTTIQNRVSLETSHVMRLSRKVCGPPSGITILPLQPLAEHRVSYLCYSLSHVHLLSFSLLFTVDETSRDCPPRSPLRRKGDGSENTARSHAPPVVGHPVCELVMKYCLPWLLLNKLKHISSG